MGQEVVIWSGELHQVRWSSSHQVVLRQSSLGQAVIRRSSSGQTVFMSSDGLPSGQEVVIG